MTHEARQAARRPVDHEGARESSAPGEPREREVITPDWVALDDDTAVCEPAVTPPAPEEKDPEGSTPARRDPPSPPGDGNAPVRGQAPQKRRVFPR